MRFFDPIHLLWLLLLVPVIIFFYLLKLKRREMVVSSTLLWSHLVKDVQANAPFQKLKKNLLLFLQLLIACLAIFALARPAYFAKSLGGGSVVVILDGSASMQSRDADPGARTPRFDAAKARALRMVGDMRGGDRMMVLLSTSRTQRLTAFSTDRTELRRAISSAEPADTTTNLRDAILLAVSAGGQQAGNRIYVLSDGAFPDMDELDTRGSEIEFVKFGSRSENVGIVAMDVRRTYQEGGGHQLFVAVRNYSREPKKANLEFYRDEALIDVRPVELPAANRETGFSEKAEVFGKLSENIGILRAKLDQKDDLPADDEAFAQLSQRRDLRVLLVTPGNLYLQKALNLDPHVQLSVTTPDAYQQQDDFDVVVFENTGPKKVGPGNHLYINCGGDTAPVEIKGRVTNATILDWERVHPAMRFVNLARLQLPEALSTAKKPWAVQLAEHESGPAIAVGERGGVKSAFVGFPLLRSDFPLRVSFPIFFNNMVQWLAAGPAAEGMQLRAGQTAPMQVPAGTDQATVTAPNGRKYELTPEGRTLYFADTDYKGIYQVTAKGLNQEFAVNLLSRDESANAPRDKIQFGRRPVAAGASNTRTAREVWRWLILLAIVVLGIEWWVYHRRI
jgi:Ca-activated chloride channel family protein